MAISLVPFAPSSSAPAVPFAKRDHRPPPSEAIFWPVIYLPVVPFGKRDHRPPPSEAIFWPIVSLPVVPFGKRDHRPPPSEAIFWPIICLPVVPFGKRDHRPPPSEAIFWPVICPWSLLRTGTRGLHRPRPFLGGHVGCILHVVRHPSLFLMRSVSASMWFPLSIVWHHHVVCVSSCVLCRHGECMHAQTPTHATYISSVSIIVIIVAVFARGCPQASRQASSR